MRVVVPVWLSFVVAQHHNQCGPSPSPIAASSLSFSRQGRHRSNPIDHPPSQCLSSSFLVGGPASGTGTGTGTGTLG